MLRGTEGPCPDCGDLRILVPVDPAGLGGPEFCCTSCDAAVVLLDGVAGDVLLSRRAC